MLEIAEAKKLAIEIYQLDKEVKASSAELAKKKELLQKYFDEFGEDQVEVHSSTSTLSVKKVVQYKLTFFPDKLKEQIRHDVFEDVTAKRHVIIDISTFIKLLRKHNVPAHLFKKFISVEYIVDQEKVRQRFSVGDILPGELKGTFESQQIKKLMIRRTRKEKEGDQN